jgi:hypothetical protein
MILCCAKITKAYKISCSRSVIFHENKIFFKKVFRKVAVSPLYNRGINIFKPRKEVMYGYLSSLNQNYKTHSGEVGSRGGSLPSRRKNSERL